MNVTDISEKKLEKTNQKLIPMYQSVRMLELELAEKLAELRLMEIQLLGVKEASMRSKARRMSGNLYDSSQ